MLDATEKQDQDRLRAERITAANSAFCRAVVEEGMPRRRGADQQQEWIEEGPHATIMTPERTLALLGTFAPCDNLAQTLAEQVEIEVRRELAGEMQDLLDVVRALSFVAYVVNNPKDGSEPAACGHPLHRMAPMVAAARRLCLHHGYSAAGQNILSEPPALHPEHMLVRLEHSERMYADVYRWLLSRAKLAGFTYVHEAIKFAIQTKKGGA